MEIWVAPKIDGNSWLNEPKHKWYKEGYEYASTQKSAIPTLAKSSPEDLYKVMHAILRDAKKKGYEIEI